MTWLLIEVVSAQWIGGGSIELNGGRTNASGVESCSLVILHNISDRLFVSACSLTGASKERLRFVVLPIMLTDV